MGRHGCRPGNSRELWEVPQAEFRTCEERAVGRKGAMARPSVASSGHSRRAICWSLEHKMAAGWGVGDD